MSSPPKKTAKKPPRKTAKKPPGKTAKKPPGKTAKKLPGWQVRARVWVRRLRTALLWWMCIGVVVPIVQVALLNVIDPPVTPTMLSRALESRSETGTLKMPAHAWVDITALPDHTISAAISSEDAHFLEHSGFDWDAIEEAWAERAAGGTAGGSPISQQTAKNVFLWQGRSWLRKGMEIWYTFLLEKLVPKDRILEVYLNIAETGPMTFGIESGAQHWYGHPAARMTAEQGTRLICLLPSPRRWTPESGHVRTRARRLMTYEIVIPNGVQKRRARQ